MASDLGGPTVAWPRPDWRNPAAYEFAQHLSRERWAWEFLRRNPGYGSDWAWFSATWRELEAEYGAPPHRDFDRWKRDPRAYRLEDGETPSQEDCEPVLIECWMGSRWGFYKFPLDPRRNAPLTGEQLAWRPVFHHACELGIADAEYLLAAPEHEPGKLGLGFDLSLPLKEQLEAARIFLAARQAQLRRSGEIALCTVATCAPVWISRLRALDARAAQVSDNDAAATLFPLDPARAETFRTLSQQADALVDGGYRDILLIPER